MIKKISGLCYEGLQNFGWRSRFSDNDLLRRSVKYFFCKHIDATSKGISMIKFPYDSEGLQRPQKNLQSYSQKIIIFRVMKNFIQINIKNYVFFRSKIKIKKFNPKIGAY